jgi:hypothetical protein
MSTLTSRTQAPTRSMAVPYVFHLPTRYVLMTAGMLTGFLALVILLQSLNSFQTTKELLDQIATINSRNVDAAELALSHIAVTTQASADLLMLTPDHPTYQMTADRVFAGFEEFRDQMFVLRANLPMQVEQDIFTNAERAIYNEFWTHIGSMWNAKERSVALAAYFAADQVLTEQIIPLLSQLEDRNYQQMVRQQGQAAQIILMQTFLLALPIFTLCILLTWLSVWLRHKLRRYLTPGVDLAMVAAWVAAITMLTTLLSVPEQLRVMVVDAYRSISASSRVLVDVNMAERAESNAILDPQNVNHWFARYDDYMHLIALRICGQIVCMERLPFAAPDTLDTADLTVVSNARTISPENAARVGGVIPLMGNITFAGEVQTIERARLAFLRYQDVHTRQRALAQTGDLNAAAALNMSDEGLTAFTAFTQAIEGEREINRQVFDRVWTRQQAAITPVYGVSLLLLVIISAGFGVYNRFREL